MTAGVKNNGCVDVYNIYIKTRNTGHSFYLDDRVMDATSSSGNGGRGEDAVENVSIRRTRCREQTHKNWFHGWD